MILEWYNKVTAKKKKSVEQLNNISSNGKINLETIARNRKDWKTAPCTLVQSNCKTHIGFLMRRPTKTKYPAPVKETFQSADMNR